MELQCDAWISLITKAAKGPAIEKHQQSRPISRFTSTKDMTLRLPVKWLMPCILREVNQVFASDCMTKLCPVLYLS